MKKHSNKKPKTPRAEISRNIFYYEKYGILENEDDKHICVEAFSEQDALDRIRDYLLNEKKLCPFYVQYLIDGARIKKMDYC